MGKLLDEKRWGVERDKRGSEEAPTETKEGNTSLVSTAFRTRQAPETTLEATKSGLEEELP